MIEEAIKNHLKKSRYIHTLGVVEYSEKLAKIYNVDLEEAKIASLLHDYGKNLSDDEILEMIKKSEYKIESTIDKTPNLGHCFASAIIAKEKFDIKNENIINAIANHTFGRTGMSDLEKIIYVSDSIEKNRDYQGIEKLRELSFINLDQAVLKICENTIFFQIKKNNLIHLNSIEMRNELIR